MLLSSSKMLYPYPPGEILVYAQCPSCPLPFRPSEMPFPQNDLHFNALHQSFLSEMPFKNALSDMSFIKMPFW